MNNLRYILLLKKIIAYSCLFLVPAVIVILYYFFYSSSGDAWSMQCTFYKSTGYLCPGCGGQRAFHSLLHGQVFTAIRYNALIVFILPFIGYCYFILGHYYIVGNKNISDKFSLKPWMVYTFLILLALFFIVRNIPFSPFTYLVP